MTFVVGSPFFFEMDFLTALRQPGGGPAVGTLQPKSGLLARFEATKTPVSSKAPMT